MSSAYLWCIVLITITIFILEAQSNQRNVFSNVDEKDDADESVIEEVQDNFETDSTISEAPALERDIYEVYKAEEVKEETKENKIIRVETFTFFPDYPTNELIAGNDINLLAGLRNIGNTVITVELIEASLRYSQDFLYSVQNFTTKKYSVQTNPKTEASFQYSFNLPESYGGRSFGLVIIAHYRDPNLVLRNISLFNATLAIKEFDVTFDLEEFFFIIFLIASVILLVVALHFIIRNNKSTKSVMNIPEKEAILGEHEIDYDWLPKETTTDFHSIKPSPRTKVKHKKQRSIVLDEKSE